MKKRNPLMKKHSFAFAAAVLMMSTGIAAAKTHHRLTASPYSTGMTGDRSSTNILDAVGPAGYRAPHEVPENGGAASTVLPGYAPN